MKNLGFLILLLLASHCTPIERYNSIANKWEKDMTRFDSLNTVNTYPKNAILFAGSSSIRLWDNIEENMAPYAVIQRGYGGASYADLAYHIDRITYPHNFAALVVFAGNDIWGKDTDRDPRESARLLRYMIKRVRKKFNNTPVIVVEVTHVPAREHLITEIDAQNKALRAITGQFDHVHWVSTKHIYLTQEGTVNKAMFRKDNVHQNDKGYGLWTEQIKNKIKEVLD